MSQNALKKLLEATRARLGLKSLADVARAAGVSESDLYNAIKGQSKKKEELLREFCQKG
jgi:lambda repressor-like predicted transcriptional regulator